MATTQTLIIHELPILKPWAIENPFKAPNTITYTHKISLFNVLKFEGMKVTGHNGHNST